MKRAVRIVTVMLTIAILTWSLQAQTLSKFDGTWRVDGVGQPFPWEVNLTVDGAKVTGTVSSCASPRQQISDGAVNGDTVTFKCRSSGGDGTIAFTGTLRGDEIDFAWSLQVREGGARPPDRNRMFGPSAPPRFIAKRVPETEAQADGVEFTAAVNLRSRDVRAIGTLFLPAKVSKARTVFVVMQYGRGESFFNDQALRTSLRGTESALLLAALPSMTTPVRYVPAGPDAGGADALIALLRRIGDESSHPELTDVPLIFWGHSAGGHFGTAFAALHPTRTLAYVRYQAGPVATVSASGIPALLIGGGKDPLNAGVEAAVTSQRLRGEPWTYAVQPDAEHGNEHALRRASPFVTLWTKAVIQQRITQDGRLGPIDERAAWLGDYRNGNVAPYPQFSGRKEATSWLPDEPTARAWQALLRAMP